MSACSTWTQCRHIGTAQQQIQVTAEAPLLMTDTGEQSTTLRTEVMTQLPNVGQDWQTSRRSSRVSRAPTMPMEHCPSTVRCRTITTSWRMAGRSSCRTATTSMWRSSRPCRKFRSTPRRSPPSMASVAPCSTRSARVVQTGYTARLTNISRTIFLTPETRLAPR